MINLSLHEFIRYSQHIKLDEIGPSGQEKLKNARVLCIGLGGIGSPLLLYLAAAGVGTLGVVDDDQVELSNLQRQILYRPSQVGLKKAKVAELELLTLNPMIKVHAYDEKLTEDNAVKLISKYDIVADCSDNFHTRYLIHDICFARRKPYVYASASQFVGYCSLFTGNGPCFRCLFPIPPAKGVIADCNRGGVLGVLPGMLGIIQATEIIKWIINIGNLLEKRMLIIDLLKMAFKEIQLSQNPECNLCAQRLASKNTDSLNLNDYSITAKQLLDLLQQENTIQLIDVRSAQEHERQNIGGKLIPLAELPYRLNELKLEEDIVLYCQSGKRSLLALNILLQAGFTHLRRLTDGIDKILKSG